MPREKKEQTFSIEPTELPQRNRGRESAYQKVLSAFMESKSKTVVVSMDGKEPANVCIGLRNLILAQKIDGVKATFRQNACYITRES